MTLRIECAPDGSPVDRRVLTQAIGREIKNQLMVSCNIELVDTCTLPRSERKSKRIFDNRPTD